MSGYLLTMLLALASTFTAQFAPGSCGKVVQKSPPPSGFRCGSAQTPISVYARRAMLTTTYGISLQQCSTNCLGATQCQSLTYQASANGDGTGTCIAYSHGAGPAMRLMPSTGVQFFNRACFFTLNCFELQSQFGFILPYSNTGVAFEQAIFVSNTQANTTFYLTSDGSLVNDVTAFVAHQYRGTVGGDTTPYNLYFPMDAQVEQQQDDFLPVTCSIDPITTQVTCSSNHHTAFYDCYAADNLNTGLALALPNTNPFSGNGNCYSVTLMAQNIA